MWIDTARGVVERFAWREVEGHVLDVQTANMLVTVHDALNEDNQVKFASLSLLRAVDIGWQLIA